MIRIDETEGKVLLLVMTIAGVVVGVMTLMWAGKYLALAMIVLAIAAVLVILILAWTSLERHRMTLSSDRYRLGTEIDRRRANIELVPGEAQADADAMVIRAKGERAVQVERARGDADVEQVRLTAHRTAITNGQVLDAVSAEILSSVTTRNPIDEQVENGGQP